MKLKIEKCDKIQTKSNLRQNADKKPLGFRLCGVVSVCVYGCGCVCVRVDACF